MGGWSVLQGVGPECGLESHIGRQQEYNFMLQEEGMIKMGQESLD